MATSVPPCGGSHDLGARSTASPTPCRLAPSLRAVQWTLTTSRGGRRRLPPAALTALLGLLCVGRSLGHILLQLRRPVGALAERSAGRARPIATHCASTGRPLLRRCPSEGACPSRHPASTMRRSHVMPLTNLQSFHGRRAPMPEAPMRMALRSGGLACERSCGWRSYASGHRCSMLRHLLPSPSSSPPGRLGGCATSQRHWYSSLWCSPTTTSSSFPILTAM